ncbi:MAG: glycerophosphoryl diester phosphodiesterase membrane domain-containing protein [Ruthenibacterium sp.]
MGSRVIKLAFNERILAAAATPACLAGVLLLLALSTAAVYYKFSVLYLTACCAAKSNPLRPAYAGRACCACIRSLKSPGVLVFAAYALGLLPLADIGISPSQLPRLHIPNFITGELSKR